MLRLLLLPAILAMGYPWDLQASHNNVIPNLTDDVTLRCLHNILQDAKSTYDQLTRIRLLKQYNTDDFKTIAEVSLPGTSNVSLTQPIDPRVTASGYLGKADESFLSITWSTASVETVGIYRCEVDGFERGTRKDIHVHSKIINVTRLQPTTKELVDMMIQLKHQFRSEIEDNFLEVRYWPTGNYTLLSPVTGCPDTPYSKMVRSYEIVKSEAATKPNHSFSSPSHLHHDVFERCDTRNIIHFRFCRNPIPDDQVVQWPKGAYCVNMYKWSFCPPGFHYGYIHGYLKSSSNLIALDTGMDFLQVGSDYVLIMFCCRDDGDPDIPVLLPNKKPFYLYRKNGKCQRVKNMKVSPEVMHLDTDDSKTDSIQYTVPDHTLNDVHIQLCYYEREKPNP